MNRPGINPKCHAPGQLRRPVTLLDRRTAYLTEEEEKEIGALLRKIFPGLAGNGSRPPQDPDSSSGIQEPESMTESDIDDLIESSFSKIADKA